jgi:hypothetical protein
VRSRLPVARASLGPRAACRLLPVRQPTSECRPYWLPDPTPRAPDSDEDQAMSDRFRRTLVSVLGVQAVTLVLLWLLQQHYSR